MCGIGGIYHYKDEHRKIEKNLVLSMATTLAHRGPDAQGLYFAEDASLALFHRRLAIIDPSPRANQPFGEEKSKIVFNGAIYNFPHLRKKHHFECHTTSDTEVLYHMLKSYGHEGLEDLEGMYALGYWDSKTKELILARDHIGIKPLYYYDDGQSFIFASELKSILKHPGIDKSIDLDTLNQYFTFGYSPSPYTPFKKVKQVKPGHCLVVTPEGVTEKLISRFHFENVKDMDIKEALNEYQEVLNKVVKEHIISDVPYTSFISGGVDSTTIASAMKDFKEKPRLTTYSFDTPSYTELQDAEIISKKLQFDLNVIQEKKPNLDTFSIIAYYSDDLICDPSLIPTYFLCRESRAQYKMALSADGGDELFLGYHTHIASLINYSIPKPIRFFMARSLTVLNHLIPRQKVRYSLKEKIKRFSSFMTYDFPHYHFNWRRIFFNDEKKKFYGPKLQGHVKKNTFNLTYTAYEEPKTFYQKLSAIDLITYLEGNLLKKLDRMSMANSLEVRVPLVSKSFISFAFQLPRKFKMKFFKQKILLRKYLDSVFGKGVLHKKKIGFSPYLDLYFKQSELLEMFERLEHSHVFYDYINREALIEELQKPEPFQTNQNALFAIINFKFWSEHFLEKA